MPSPSAILSLVTVSTVAPAEPTPDPTSRPRRWPHRLLLATAATVVVLGSATWWFFDGPGRRYQEGTTRIEAARVDDESVVVTFTGGKPLAVSELCGEDYEATVEESDTTVTVTVHRYRLRPQPPFSFYGCTMEGYARTVSAELNRPLGDRDLIDGTTGENVDVRRTPVWGATWLPAGWSLQNESGFFIDQWSLGYGPDPSRESPYVWVGTDGSGRPPTVRGASEAVSVRGTEGTLYIDDIVRSVVWTENGESITVMGTLSTDDLLRVAESLEPT